MYCSPSGPVPSLCFRTIVARTLLRRSTSPVPRVAQISNFFFKNTATTKIYTLSLHDALPILQPGRQLLPLNRPCAIDQHRNHTHPALQDRKSTRLNSSHSSISYAVFCLK